MVVQELKQTIFSVKKVKSLLMNLVVRKADTLRFASNGSFEKKSTVTEFRHLCPLGVPALWLYAEG